MSIPGNPHRRSAMANPPTKRDTSDQDPYESSFGYITNVAERLRDGVLKSSNPEECQKLVRDIDKVLKDLADAQFDIGKLRNEASSHVQNLRRAKPKGKPAEGTVTKDASGKSYIFLKGAWAPYNAPEPDKKAQGQS